MKDSLFEKPKKRLTPIVNLFLLVKILFSLPGNYRLWQHRLIYHFGMRDIKRIGAIEK